MIKIMNLWMFLVLIYGLLKGAREAVKKKSLEKSSVPEVLFFYTLIGFVFVIPDGLKGFSVDPYIYALITIKSLCIFVAWILSFKVIKEMPIGFYGILDMSRVLFAYLLGIIVLREQITVYQMIGMPLVLIGLFMLKILKGDKSEDKAVSMKHVLLAIFSCLLNAVSGLFDKIIMNNNTVSSGELQFGYMLVLVILYCGYLFVTKTKINVKDLKTNYWIVILAVMFVIADRCLFIANKDPNSKITIMTLIKQSACFVTIFLGRVVYKERETLKKVICATIILAGMVIAVMGNKNTEAVADLNGDATISAIDEVQKAGSDSANNNEDADSENEIDEEVVFGDIDKVLENASITESSDAGEEYINDTLFIGDSNTVRMMNYGFTTLENTLAVTGMGIQSVETLKCIEFEGYKEPVTIVEAVKIMQPRRIIITFGTNNAGGMDTESFINRYKKVLESIHNAYEYADIIINSVPPFHKINKYPSLSMDKINTYNLALADMAKELGHGFVDTSSVLKDKETGYAKDDYVVNDGIHIAKAGFEEMFMYFRTHSSESEDKRPKPLKDIPKQKGTVYVISGDGKISHDPSAFGDMSDKDNPLTNPALIQNEIEKEKEKEKEETPVEEVPKENQEPVHKHKYDKGKVIKEPTYTEEGEMLYSCVECGKELERQVIPALIDPEEEARLEKEKLLEQERQREAAKKELEESLEEQKRQQEAALEEQRQKFEEEQRQREEELERMRQEQEERLREQQEQLREEQERLRKELEERLGQGN